MTNFKFLGDIINFREKDFEKKHRLTGQYSHKVNDKIYYQIHNGSESEIRYSQIKNNLWEKPTNNLVLKDSMACHNFRVFLDKEGKYKAIGGFHCNSTHPALKEKKATTLEEHQVLDPVWPNVARSLYDSESNHNMHANGYYIFKSDDGIKWEEYYHLPVFSSDTIISGDDTSGYLSSDNMPCVFWDDKIKKYRVYVRANIKLGVRYVCTSTSDDLITWEKFKYINVDPEFNFDNGNIYFFNVIPFEFEDFHYISISPTFNNYILSSDGSKREYKNHGNTIFLSKNGIDWVSKLSLLFEKNPKGHMTFPHVYSYEFENNLLSLYVIKNYLTHECKMSKYQINLQELLKRSK